MVITPSIDREKQCLNFIKSIQRDRPMDIMTKGRDRCMKHLESSKRLCAFVRSAPADILGAESDYEFPKCVNS